MKPLIKWAGGKTKLLPVIRDIIGKQRIRNYFEPFFGGGALYFDIWEQIGGRSFLSDANERLIDTYLGVQSNPEGVTEAIRSLYSVEYEQLKERFNYQDPKTPLALKAARFLALNFLCYNGLWRVNKSGEFNVPIGRDSRKHPRQLQSLELYHIKEISSALKNATIDRLSFDQIYPQSHPGDLWFFDPPYLGTFSDYTADGFGIAQHEKLWCFSKTVAACGARVIVCGSDNELTQQVYGEPTIRVTLNRTIGASKRGITSEALYLF